MARGKKAARKDGGRTCWECALAYDFHEIGADGRPFMCRCPHKEWCRFTDDPACDLFKNK